MGHVRIVQNRRKLCLQQRFERGNIHLADTTAQVWAGSAPDDWTRRLPGVRVLGVGHGRLPTEKEFGAFPLPCDDVMGHDGYYRSGTSSRQGGDPPSTSGTTLRWNETIHPSYVRITTHFRFGPRAYDGAVRTMIESMMA